ncbi:MAG: hypothetical protein ACJ8GN_13680 [Longimicrobiaceae bacterium]
MDRSKLEIDSLEVSSFEISQPAIQPVDGMNNALPGGGYCCTGCVSGCGIYPTNGGCESGGGDTTYY